MEDKKKELHSLNEGLPSFYLEELEQRLETDPLGVTGLLSQYSASLNTGDSQGFSDSEGDCQCNCNNNNACTCNCNNDCGNNGIACPWLR